jgi:hypothetical protein
MLPRLSRWLRKGRSNRGLRTNDRCSNTISVRPTHPAYSNSSSDINDSEYNMQLALPSPPPVSSPATPEQVYRRHHNNHSHRRNHHLSCHGADFINNSDETSSYNLGYSGGDYKLQPIYRVTSPSSPPPPYVAELPFQAPSN